MNRVLWVGDSANPTQAYDSLGAGTREALLSLLPDDWDFAGKRVLDFGCGAGRTLRHFLEEARLAEIWGSDIDGPSIDWLTNVLSPPLKALKCRDVPPLPFEAGTFDLVWAISVFTHLTDSSFSWLVELHRLLKPGGLLIATYMGRWNGDVFTHEPWDESRVGMNILRRDQEWARGGPIVLMSDWWVRAHWGRAFEIVSVTPAFHGQTWVLLRKRDIAVSVRDLEEPADDPREYLALRHNLRQVEREHERALAEVREYYEQSSSWRITRGFRQAASLIRRLSSNFQSQWRRIGSHRGR